MFLLEVPCCLCFVFCFLRLILTCGICFYSMYVLMVLFLTLIPVKHFVNLISVKGAILNKLIIIIIILL